MTFFIDHESRITHCSRLFEFKMLWRTKSCSTIYLTIRDSSILEYICLHSSLIIGKAGQNIRNKLVCLMIAIRLKKNIPEIKKINGLQLLQSYGLMVSRLTWYSDCSSINNQQQLQLSGIKCCFSANFVKISQLSMETCCMRWFDI